MTIIQKIAVWYIIGVVSYLLFQKIILKNVQIRDLVDSFIIGIGGPLVSIIAFGALLMVPIIDWYKKIKHKKIF